ncbi:hypothetical protein AADR41_26870 [Streptomyces sp. CLV115]|uniref:hypothetical protein n=1 Tax=Streptomyces sp. CLV115 TaxID=3138502 RepID=UPI00313BFFD5
MAAPAADPDDRWAGGHSVSVDRTTLAWCTAAQILVDHHTGIDRQVLAVDALLRELGIRGLAQSTSTSGIGEDATRPTRQGIGRPPEYEFAGHDHIFPVREPRDVAAFSGWLGAASSVSSIRSVSAPCQGTPYSAVRLRVRPYAPFRGRLVEEEHCERTPKWACSSGGGKSSRSGWQL